MTTKEELRVKPVTQYWDIHSLHHSLVCCWLLLTSKTPHRIRSVWTIESGRKAGAYPPALRAPWFTCLCSETGLLEHCYGVLFSFKRTTTTIWTWITWTCLTHRSLHTVLVLTSFGCSGEVAVDWNISTSEPSVVECSCKHHEALFTRCVYSNSKHHLMERSVHISAAGMEQGVKPETCRSMSGSLHCPVNELRNQGSERILSGSPTGVLLELQRNKSALQLDSKGQPTSAAALLHVLSIYNQIRAYVNKHMLWTETSLTPDPQPSSRLRKWRRNRQKMHVYKMQTPLQRWVTKCWKSLKDLYYLYSDI